jgi:hypothetical protein
MIIFSKNYFCYISCIVLILIFLSPCANGDKIRKVANSYIISVSPSYFKVESFLSRLERRNSVIESASNFIIVNTVNKVPGAIVSLVRKSSKTYELNVILSSNEFAVIENAFIVIEGYFENKANRFRRIIPVFYPPPKYSPEKKLLKIRNDGNWINERIIFTNKEEFKDKEIFIPNFTTTIDNLRLSRDFNFKNTLAYRLVFKDGFENIFKVCMIEFIDEPWDKVRIPLVIDCR